MSVGTQSHCFRIRISMPPSVKLGVDEPQVTASVTGVGDVTLRSLNGKAPLAEAEAVLVSGPRFPTERAAMDAAARVRSCLQLALARLRIGADFGDRRPRGGGMSAAAREGLLLEYGQRVLNDVHGTQVYECDPPPMFAHGSAVGLRLVTPAGKVQEAIEAAAERLGERDPSLEVAYDLFAASFFVASQADARFLMLMMAVEAMLELERRPPAIVAHVESLICQTRDLELPADHEHHRQAIATALGFLRDESIRQAGRRLASTLGNRSYGPAETPERFFSACYDVRSRLTHGRQPLPAREEVASRGAALEVFVAHLLSREILDAVAD